MGSINNRCADACFSFNLNVTPQSPDGHPQSKTQSFASAGALMEVINQMYIDNKKMTTMVSQIFHDYTSLHSQLMQYFTSNSHGQNCSLTDDHETRKRNAYHMNNNINDDDDTMNNKTTNCLFTDVGNCCKRIKMMNVKPKVSTIFVRIELSDSSSVVKDGYQWRKYGQKVTRDNPSPRAYFKCSFAPLCPVKKKVQKSVEDPTVLVVTYEGEHTHKKPSSQATSLTPSTMIPPLSPIDLSPSSINSTASDHLIRNLLVSDHTNENSEEENVDDQDRSPVQHWLVEQMASSLIKDPKFASALATAISEKVLEQTFC